MTSIHSLDHARQQSALEEWKTECGEKLKKRFPHIVFSASHWALRSANATEIKDFNFEPASIDFLDRDVSFLDAIRCIASEYVLDESIKSLHEPVAAMRLLLNCDATTVSDLTLAQVKAIETHELARCKRHPASAEPTMARLTRLSKCLGRLAAKGVISKIPYSVTREVAKKFTDLRKVHRTKTKENKRSILDHQIEALSDAMNALFRNDPRLSNADKASLAAMGMEMCAPSRINEILCCSLHDRVTLDDYTRRASDESFEDKLFEAHQTLIITTKGSKGAQWGAKPILNFMIDLFNFCFDLILQLGSRSRMLVHWYINNPTKLYLPPELEHLRGDYISREQLVEIINLQAASSHGSLRTGMDALVFKTLKKHVVLGGGVSRAGWDVNVIPWNVLEPHLLTRVQVAMKECRSVTTNNSYLGKLENMLFLFDRETAPFLPFSMKYRSMRARVIHPDRRKSEARCSPEMSVFEKLGIMMPVDGRMEIAYIQTHDPRKWLTTHALSHPDSLSDALINAWARRLDIDQLSYYDFRTPEQKADQVAMPAMFELEDLTAGIRSVRGAEEEFGLEASIVTVQNAGIAMTSMEAIATSVSDRPVARQSEQIIILYPTWYGACVHAHHETPCRAYDSCLPCDKDLVVKGHIPTNDAVRKRKSLLMDSIVMQLEKFALAHSREIADDQEVFSQHLLALTSKGLKPSEMAEELVERFHEIKHDIKDVTFRNKLEEAFVATGYVERFDDPAIASGALMKYHNPSRHAAPGTERAMDAHGGREQIIAEREALALKFPEFAPTALGLVDQRHLLEQETEGEEDDGADAEESDEAAATDSQEVSDQPKKAYGG